mmetsp:Transcript_27037/g.26669  ORF Transcript_27037/g.26669 Transcript_27037/m.26669 type:complete len:110 (+) Transcript_27037:88-417(+)
MRELDMEEEFHDPSLDTKLESWSQNKFGKRSETVLSCPQCFSAITYKSIPQEKSFLSKKTINTCFSKTVGTSENDINFVINCKICMAELGVYDPSLKNYHLLYCLPGYG